MDDLLIYATCEKTLVILKEVFQVFRENGLIVCPAKAAFLQNEIIFLGKKVTRKGVSETDSQLKKVIEAEKPKTLKQLQKFLGMMAFVCQRIPNINIISKDLYNLVGESQSKPFNWQEKHDLSFERAKKAMTTAIETNPFDVNEKGLLRYFE